MEIDEVEHNGADVDCACCGRNRGSMGGYVQTVSQVRARLQFQDFFQCKLQIAKVKFSLLIISYTELGVSVS